MNDEAIRDLRETLDILDKALSGKVPTWKLEQVKKYFSASVQLAFAQGRLHGIYEVGG